MRVKVLTALQTFALIAMAAGMFILARQVTALTTMVAGSTASIAATTTSPLAGPHLISQKELEQIHAAQQRMDVLAFNIAHAKTIGFKRMRAEQPPGPNQGSYLLDMTEGGLEKTGGLLDVAIAGDGFFHIKVSPTQGDGTAYTRVGELMVNKYGDVIVNVNGGCELIPPINLPSGATNMVIAEDGTISYVPQGGASPSIAGMIHLCRFMNAPALVPQNSFYFESAESGPAIISKAGENGTGTLMQGYLEQSNVSPVNEWAAMVSCQQQLQIDRNATQLLEQTRQAVAGLDKD